MSASAGEPASPVAAATHPNPYPYYARLVAERPLYRDEGLGLWVASGASEVAEILASDACHVRPPAERVPRSLGDSSTAHIFRRLVRMNDDERHCPLKRAIVATLDGIEHCAASDAAQQRAAALGASLLANGDYAGLTHFIFALPVQTTAALLGVPEAQLAAVTECVEGFVDGISPLATPADLEKGGRAASRLLESFADMLTAQRASNSNTLLNVLAREARAAGRGLDDLIIANGIGLLSQTYEATAGLIGNTLLALSRGPAVLAAARTAPALVAGLVHHVLRADPPTQSTRRFVTHDIGIAGQPLRAGDAVLVMLAAAGRDPVINAHPDDFDPNDDALPLANFGAGRHACPASELAPLIAAAAVNYLLASAVRLDDLHRHCRYRRSNHLRMPLFG